jgi:bifunctional hydroxylase/dehydrase
MSRTVIVVGAGPAGLMLACELGLKGVDTLLVERDADPIAWSRSQVIQMRSLEVLRQRDMDWFSDFPPYSAYNFGFLELAKLNRDPKIIPLHVPQRLVEQRLEERARELGVEIRRGHELVGVTQDGAGVTATVATTAERYEVRADYLVGCDGGRSAVRKLADIGFPGTESTLYGITGDIDEVNGRFVDDRYPEGIKPRIYPGGLFAAQSFEPGLYRATSIEFESKLPSREVPATREEMLASIRRVAGLDLKIDKFRYVARFGNATRVAETYRVGRVFLAGDAAHIHFPSAGQGLNTSIQDAVNLGWKLAATVQGWAPPDLLDTYHAERHPVGQRICMYSQAQVALYHPLDRVGPLRELFSELILNFPPVRQLLLDLSTGAGVRYSMPYGGEGSHALLGGRFPEVGLVVPGEGEVSSAGLLRSGSGVLLHLSGSVPVPDVAGWGGRVRVVVAEPVRDVGVVSVLLRPDGYVAFVDGDGSGGAGLREALTTWFGPGTG